MELLSSYCLDARLPGAESEERRRATYYHHQDDDPDDETQVTTIIVLCPAQDSQFTEFFILGEGGLLQDFVTTLTLDSSQQYNLGIVNQEGGTEEYEVEAILNGVQAGTFGPFILRSGEEWAGTISVTPTDIGDDQKLEVRLRKLPSQETYRSVHLFVDVES